MEKDDRRSDQKHGERVTHAPEGADEAGRAYVFLPGDDGGDGHDVVGVCRVPDAQEEADS